MRILWATGFVLLSLCGQALADDDVPDRAIVRRRIDSVIADAPSHRATIGVLQETMILSIAFGAPTWNAGDHDGCCNFYIKTGESLCSSFGGTDAASPKARKILDDLKSAIDRVKQSSDADVNAWAMRFVFDKTQAMLLTETDSAARMLELGQESVTRSQFEDAANAFNVAEESLHELDGQPVDDIPAVCRYAPIALSDALFGQKKYKQASAALEEGLHFVPELPDQEMDLRKHFADPAIYRLLAEDLAGNARSHPDDTSLQMLVGYHLFFTGQKAKAKPYFEKVLQLDAKDAGAKLMLEQYDPSHTKVIPKEPPPRGVGV